MNTGDIGIAIDLIAGFMQHGIAFGIFLLFADMAWIIQFNNSDYFKFLIEQNEVGDFAIKLVTDFKVIVGDQGAKSHLSKNMMLGKGFFETNKHLAFEMRDDAFGKEFLPWLEQLLKNKGQQG